MAARLPTRDDISKQIFGRKFSELSSDSKTYVDKTLGVMHQASRSGNDSSAPLRQAAFKETVSIVKQLKEILVNPGDVIELPAGVLQDAARVINYQSQAIGRGRVLDPKEMNAIKKEILKKFGKVDPRIVGGITDYLTSTTGRFSGVGPRTLRRKLGSFLTKSELETISNKEIVTARDIVIAHLFDKWSGGNLSSFVGPKVDDLLKQELRDLKKTQKASKPTGYVPKEEIRKTIEALESLERFQNEPDRLSNPVVKQALKNLGLSPSQIIAGSTKSAMGAITNSTRDFALSRGKPVGGGMRTRRNWSIHTRATPEYRESLPSKYPIFGIGKKTSVSSRPYKQAFSAGWKYDVPRMWEGGNENEAISAAADYLASETADFSNSSAEAEYGSNARYKLKGNSAGIPIDAGPSRVTEHYTGLIAKYAGSVTSREAAMGVSLAERKAHYQDISRYEQSLEEYTDAFGDKWGRRFHEAGIPISVGHQVLSMPGAARYNAYQNVMRFYNEGTSRYERKIGINPDEMSLFSPGSAMAGLYNDLTQDSPVMKSVSAFKNLFGAHHPGELPTEIRALTNDIARGDVSIPGVKRVGVVGSKSWDNKGFLNTWLRKNFDSNNILVTSTEVGKTLDQRNIGVEYMASNWAHHNQMLQHKVPKRLEWGKDKSGRDKQFNKTIEDVISNSDEIVAFFEMANPDKSTIAQLNYLQQAIGDKPLRIVWVPTNLAKHEGKSFGSMLFERFKDKGNLTIDKYSPGAVPASLKAMDFKYLATGGSLKPNQNAIVGERGPEALVPDGHGGFNVIPNSSLRFLEAGTFTPRKNVIVATGDKSQEDAHFYKTSEGKILPSVSTVLSNYSDEAAAHAAAMTKIPEWVSQVGNYAHAMAESHAAMSAGLDDSRFPLPDLTKFVTRTQSAAALIEKGETAGMALIRGLEQMGFQASAIEERFVDLEKGFSGTIDLLGSIAGTPAVLDLKAQGNSTFGKESERYMLQVGAYASMFAELPDMLKVLTANRETGEIAEYTYVGDQIQEAVGKWEYALEQFNHRLAHGYVNIPGLTAGPASTNAYKDLTAADNRLMEMMSTRVQILNPAGGTGPYERQGITTTVPGHASALGKIFPPFKIGGKKNPEWDKHPDRLNVFDARLSNMYNWAQSEPAGVAPIIQKIIGSLGKGGVGYGELSYLMKAPMGSVQDNPDLIRVMRQFYDALKPVAFKQETLEGDASAKLLWEDARTFLNVFEEAGKAFQSMPDFTKPLPKTALIPMGLPIPGEENPISPQNESAAPKVRRKKCPGVDLCEPTLAALRAMFRGSGSGVGSGGTRGPYKTRNSNLVANQPIPSSLRSFLEAMPIIGSPLTMKRRWGEAQTNLDNFDPNLQSYEDYVKLQQKEEIARNKYYRSIRGATTGFLIMQHVMRVFGQSSQIMNKGMNAVGRGFGYIMDMALLPLLPALPVITNGLISFGNVVRKLGSGPMLFGVGYLIGKTIREFYDLGKSIGGIPGLIDKLNQSLDNLSNTISRVIPGMQYEGVTDIPESKPGQQYQNPIGPSRPGILSRAKNWLHFAHGGVVPGTGNKDSVLAMLTPGEIIVPKSMIPHYAEGGVSGGLSSIIGNVAGLYASALSSDVGQAIVGTIGVVSKMTGAMMAPLSPLSAGMVVGGRGWTAVQKAVERGTAVTSAINSEGFGAVRTVGAGILIPVIGAAATLLGIYGWAQGYGAFMESTIASVNSLINSGKAILSSIFNAARDIYNLLKDFLKPKDLLPKDVKTPTPPPDEKWKWVGKVEPPKLPGPGEGADDKLKFENRKRLNEKLLEESKKKLLTSGEEELPKKGPSDQTATNEPKRMNRPGSAQDYTPPKWTWEPPSSTPVQTGEPIAPKGIIENIKDIAIKSLKGVPGMAALGGLIGAAETGNPIEIGKSAIFGGAAQYAFNAVGNIASKIPYVGGAAEGLIGGLGGFLAPDFANTLSKAFISGKGPLAIGKYLGVSGNKDVESAVRIATSQLITGTNVPGNVGSMVSDIVGGIPGILNGGKGGIMTQIGQEKISGNFGPFGTMYSAGYNYPFLGQMASLTPGNPAAAGANMKGVVEIVNALKDVAAKLQNPTINQNNFEIKQDTDWNLMQKISDFLNEQGNHSGNQGTF